MPLYYSAWEGMMRQVCLTLTLVAAGVVAGAAVFKAAEGRWVGSVAYAAMAATAAIAVMRSARRRPTAARVPPAPAESLVRR